MTFNILSITCFVSITHNGKLAGVSWLMFKNLISNVLAYYYYYYYYYYYINKNNNNMSLYSSYQKHFKFNIFLNIIYSYNR